jgi:hypothetical protein
MEDVEFVVRPFVVTPMPIFGLPIPVTQVKAARHYATRGFQEISDNQEWQEAKFQDRRRSQGPPALFRGPAGLRRRDYYTSANVRVCMELRIREARLA